MCNAEQSSCLVRGRRSAARALAVLGIGAGVLAGAAPTEAQTGAPTRLRVDAVRHVSGGNAEVDLTWLHRRGATAVAAERPDGRSVEGDDAAVHGLSRAADAHLADCAWQRRGGA